MEESEASVYIAGLVLSFDNFLSSFFKAKKAKMEEPTLRIVSAEDLSFACPEVSSLNIPFHSLFRTFTFTQFLSVSARTIFMHIANLGAGGGGLRVHVQAVQAEARDQAAAILADVKARGEAGLVHHAVRERERKRKRAHAPQQGTRTDYVLSPCLELFAHVPTVAQSRGGMGGKIR